MHSKTIFAPCWWRIDILIDFGGNHAGQLKRHSVAEGTGDDEIARATNRAAFINDQSESLDWKVQCDANVLQVPQKQESLESQAAVGVR